MTTPASGSPRVRMDADSRREQLLELGVRLMGVRPLEEVTIDLLAEEAGISRGLLYHYFGSKTEFHTAVARSMVAKLYAATAPIDEPDVLVRMNGSLHDFIGFLRDNHRAYLSFIRAAAGGNAEMKQMYDAGKASLLDRIFEQATAEELAALGIVDSPAVRLMTSGWGEMVEAVILEWLEDDRGIPEDALVESLTVSLGAVLQVAPVLPDR